MRNVAFLDRLVGYLAENIGSILSAKKISDFLKSQRVHISPNIVLDYLSYLCAAFFVHRVRRRDVRGKKVFEINDKHRFSRRGFGVIATGGGDRRYDV